MYGIKTSIKLEDINVPEEKLWRYYLGFLPEQGRPFLSPLRKESNPSANLFCTQDGTILLKDFALGTFNIYQFVAKKYGLVFQDAVEKIYRDSTTDSLKLEEEIYENLEKFVQKDPTKIQIEVRSWKDMDLEYWGQYKITLPTLQFFKVLPIKALWINDKFVRVDYKTYSYEYGGGIRKIYSPDTKTFYNNIPAGVYAGYNTLPKRGKLLIITASQKDAMVWHELGYIVISPQTEGMLDGELMIELKNRFKRIVLNYDNDEAGIKYTQLNVKKYNIDYLFVSPYNEISEYTKNKKELPNLIL